jgi:hypothetical protein
MDMQYHLKTNKPDNKLQLSIEVMADDERHMFTGLQLNQLQITQSSLNKILINYPLMTLKVLGAIYWQALKLWLKGVPIHNIPK